jgi:hypothetical protein
MSGGQGGWATPGVGTERTTYESEILWGADQARNAALWQSSVFSGAARDAGNSPTTILRPGLIMGKLTSGGELEEWDADAADGSQYIAGILDSELRAQDFDATNADRVFRALVARAPVKARKLLIQGAAFVGHVDEYLARRQLVAAGFVFDDDPQGFKAGAGYRFETITAEDHTITADDNGKTFIYTHTAAAASAITLPAIKPGLEFNLLRGANSAEDFVIASAEGDNMIVGNDSQADSVTWTTTGQMIGAGGRMRSMYVGTDLRWHFDLYTPPFGTGLTGGFAYAIATA